MSKTFNVVCVIGVALASYIGYIEYQKYESAEVYHVYGNVVEYPSCDDTRCRTRVAWLNNTETIERFASHAMPVIGEGVTKTCYRFKNGTLHCESKLSS